MSGVPINTFSGAKLESLPGFPAVTEALAFMPSLTIAKGDLLSQVTSTSANEVQTINYSDTWAAGDTITVSIKSPTGVPHSTTMTFDANGALTAANLKKGIEALLAAAGYEGATVAVANNGPTDQTVTFGGSAAAWDMPLMTATYVTAGDGTVQIDATTAGNKIGLWGPYVGTKLADPTAAATVTSKTGGTALPLLMQGILSYTFITAVGETLPSPGAAFALTTTDRTVAVAAITVPTGATGVNYYINGVYAATGTGMAKDIATIATTASKPLPTKNTAFTATDGRHVAQAIAIFDMRTNSLGKVAIAGADQQPQGGVYDASAPAYFSGAFKSEEINGLTADAAADLGAKVAKGSLTSGIVVI